MFYSKIYRGKVSNQPSVDDPDKTSSITDPDLKKIIQSSVEDTHYSNEKCFFLDSVAQSYAYIVAYTIIGDGVKFTVPDNLEAEEKIRDFNKSINLHNDTIDDYIIDSVIDNFIFGYSLWRVKNADQSIDVQRISPKTITIKIDPTHGYRKFVQEQTGTVSYDSYLKFLKEEYSFKSNNTSYINIPDDPTVCVYSSFFRKAPIAAVNHLIVYKRWILMFLRKYAERMWAPSRIGYVGDPKTNYMPQDNDMQESIDELSEAMNQLRNFSNVAIPGNYRIDTEDLQSNGEIFLKNIEMLNEEIMFGLFGSMGIRRTNETFKSNNVVAESVVHVFHGIRHEIERALKNLYVNNVVPEVTQNQIISHWSPLRSSTVSEYTDAIVEIAKIGGFKDMREVRRASSIVFPFLAETELTDAEEKKLYDFMVLINAPSQPGEDTPTVAKKGNSRAAA